MEKLGPEVGGFQESKNLTYMEGHGKQTPKDPGPIDVHIPRLCEQLALFWQWFHRSFPNAEIR